MPLGALQVWRQRIESSASSTSVTSCLHPRPSLAALSGLGPPHRTQPLPILAAREIPRLHRLHGAPRHRHPRRSKQFRLSSDGRSPSLDMAKLQHVKPPSIDTPTLILPKDCEQVPLSECEAAGSVALASFPAGTGLCKCLELELMSDSRFIAGCQALALRRPQEAWKGSISLAVRVGRIFHLQKIRDLCNSGFVRLGVPEQLPAQGRQGLRGESGPPRRRTALPCCH